MKEDLYSKYIEKQEQKEIEEQKNIINNKQEITMLEIGLLDEFKNHIFSAISQNKFEELKESISRSGILMPIIVRKKEDRYEIIAGHNRVRACKELEKKEIPAIIKDYDDDMAELIMIDTNLAQRENILPCEKGLAYKIRYELIKKISKENGNKSSDTNDYIEKSQTGNLSSLEKLADESEDGKSQIARFIRLTKLNEGLQNKVNNNILGTGVGYELSFIKADEQDIINEVLDNNNIKLSVNQAEKLRAVYGTITKDNVLEIIKGKPKKKEDKFTGKLLSNICKKYKDKFANDKEFSELVDFLLENHYKNLSDIRRTK